VPIVSKLLGWCNNKLIEEFRSAYACFVCSVNSKEPFKHSAIASELRRAAQQRIQVEC